MFKMKQFLVGLTVLATTPVVFAQSASYPFGGKFIMEAGKGMMITKRNGCGALKERPYYHEVEFKQDKKFVERIYITGIAQPNLELHGKWWESKKRIYLNYDGAINDGATADINSGWAPLLGDIEIQLVDKCRMTTGVSIIYPATRMQIHSLKVNNSGSKAIFKMKLKGQSQGGYTKPKATSRSVVTTGRFESNSR